MTQIARVVLRAALSVLGAVALYVILYGGTGWVADQLGYQSALGQAFGVVNRALSPLALGSVAVLLFAIVLFLILTRFAFIGRSAQRN